MASRAVPPPLPVATRPAEQPLPRVTRPVAAPATIRAGRGSTHPGDDDQFDIPAFLRKNGGREER